MIKLSNGDGLAENEQAKKEDKGGALRKSSYWYSRELPV